MPQALAKRINKILLPVLSRLSKYRYVYSLKKHNKGKASKTVLHFIIERWDDTSALSLDSLLKTDFKEHNIEVFCCCYSKDMQVVKEALKGNGVVKLLPCDDTVNIFEFAITHALTFPAAVLQCFCHAEALFHKNWLNELQALSLQILQNERNYKIGAISIFNPNDYKLFKTLKTSEDYVIKNGFSFLCICFYNDFLKKYKNLIVNKPQGEEIISVFNTYEFFAAFATNSYIEGIRNTSKVGAESFYPKQNNLAFAENPVKDGWLSDENQANKFTYLKLRTLVIQIVYEGLGDHLFYSHLPRIAKETGRYDKVYISNYSKLRQKAFRELIWESNPYIDGFCDEYGYYIEFLKIDTNKMNLLDKIMLLHDMDDGVRFHEPELYYKKVIKPELQNKTLFVPNYMSNAGQINIQKVENYLSSNNLHVDFQMQLRDNNYPVTDFGKWLDAESLEDFFNVIHSCKNIFCYTTGTATLAAALGTKAYVFYGEGVNTDFHHSKNNIYIKT